MESSFDIMHLIYCSRATNFENKEEFERNLHDIFSQSQTYNSLHEITGALMTDGEMFAQVIEGPMAAVSAMYSKIVNDQRHENIIELQRALVHVRLFNFWPLVLLRKKNISHVRTLNSQSTLNNFRKTSVYILKSLRPVILR